MLVFPTLYGHLCAGPSAVDQDNKEDWNPRADELEVVHARAAALMPMLGDLQPVDAWAGLRPVGQPTNYVVEWSARVPTMLQVAAIRSTGLSACLGLAEHVLQLLAARSLRLAAPRALVPSTPSTPATPWWQQLNTFHGVQAHVARH